MTASISPSVFWVSGPKPDTVNPWKQCSIALGNKSSFQLEDFPRERSSNQLSMFSVCFKHPVMQPSVNANTVPRGKIREKEVFPFKSSNVTLKHANPSLFNHELNFGRDV